MSDVIADPSTWWLGQIGGPAFKSEVTDPVNAAFAALAFLGPTNVDDDVSGYTGVAWQVIRLGPLSFMVGHVNKGSGSFASSYTTIGHLPDSSWAPTANFKAPILADASSNPGGSGLFIASGDLDIQVITPSGSAFSTLYCAVGPWLTP